MDFNNIKIDKDKVGFFRFKKIGDEYLITNDITHIRINEETFKLFLEGKLDKNSIAYKNLSERGFIKDEVNMKGCVDGYCKRNHFLFNHGVVLHIMVVTKRCNYQCVYCQAGREEAQKEEYDMTEETARKTVDLIFQSPVDGFTIEFQGGEPLINWDVIKFVIEYAQEKNKIAKKNMSISLVTNLSLMTEEKYNYLIENNVGICTSLDGPAHVQNKNRPFYNGDSYEIVSNWLKKSRKVEKERNLSRQLSALVTLTRYSLEHIEEIIDEYIKNGFSVIHLRRLSFLGYASGEDSKNSFGYTAEEFIEAWKRGMDYIIQKNIEGKSITERGAAIMLAKILKEVDPSFLDLRSPCGAGIGQLAYFYNGDIYSCDEGRMLGNDLFLLGNVNKDNCESISQNSRLKTLVTASTLDNFACDECAYKPYCGICPVLNYMLHGTLFPNVRTTDQCKVNEAMLDYLFLKMKDPEVLGVFEKWMSGRVG